MVRNRTPNGNLWKMVFFFEKKLQNTQWSTFELFRVFEGTVSLIGSRKGLPLVIPGSRTVNQTGTHFPGTNRNTETNTSFHGRVTVRFGVVVNTNHFYTGSVVQNSGNWGVGQVVNVINSYRVNLGDFTGTSNNNLVCHPGIRVFGPVFSHQVNFGGGVGTSNNFGTLRSDRDLCQ